MTLINVRIEPTFLNSIQILPIISITVVVINTNKEISKPNKSILSL